MKFEEKKIVEKGQGSWIVTFEESEWKKYVEKGKKRYAQNIEIPGFRKGKAPEEKVAKYMNPVKYLNEALKASMEDAWNFAKEQKSTVEPFNSPVTNPISISETECVLEFKFDLKPEIKIGKYKGLKSEKLKKESNPISKEDIQRAIDQYKERFAMEKDKNPDSKIKNGDVVIFDFEGFIEGVAFPGGKGLDFKLPIGSKRMIPGFEDSMIGLAIGENQSINVKFPDDYTPRDLAGKNAEFKLNIKGIKELILPKEDDDLAKDLNIKGVETFEELKKHIEKELEKQANSQLKNIFVNNVIELIKEDSKIEIPKSAIEKEVENLYKEFEARVTSQKMTIKEYKKQTGFSDADIRQELFADAKKRLESYLITDAVRNNEKFEILDHEIDKKFEDLASSFGINVKEIKDVIISSDQIKEEIIKEKIIDFLYENNG